MIPGNPSEEPTSELPLAEPYTPEELEAERRKYAAIAAGRPEPSLPNPNVTFPGNQPVGDKGYPSRLAYAQPRPRPEQPSWVFWIGHARGVEWEYDLLDWAIRIGFLVLGVLIGWAAHGLHP